MSWLLDSDDVSGSLFIRLPAGHAQRRAGAQRAPARSQGFAPPGCERAVRGHPRAPRGLLRPGVDPARETLRVGVNAACIGGCFRSVPTRGRPDLRRTALVVKPARNGTWCADTGSGAICRPCRPMPPHNAQGSRDRAADARQVRGPRRLVLADVKVAGSRGCFRSEAPPT